ncbi:arf-GAP with dual PH domain-containing protein 2 isoform X2 [Lissotriton helveticus]
MLLFEAGNGEAAEPVPQVVVSTFQGLVVKSHIFLPALCYCYTALFLIITEAARKQLWGAAGGGRLCFEEGQRPSSDCKRAAREELGSQRMSGGNEKLLYEIKTLPGNQECADCGAPDPVWTSYQLGIFICVECSGIHRDLHGISKVKSVHLDYWKDEQIQNMKENGNLLTKAKYEAKVPPFYYRPRPEDCLVLKEQWIRAKYQREEFTANKDIIAWYISGLKEGFLWKRGKDKKQFQSRKFVLSEEEGVLKYYMTSDCKNPKSVINLRDLNAIFQPEKIGHRNGLAFIFMKDSQTRSIFVYHENGEDIVDWFNCIRAARLRYLKKAFPDTPESELILRITRNYVKEGYMEKTGPKHREAFKKRWFTLDSMERKLLYYKRPMRKPTSGKIIKGL